MEVCSVQLRSMYWRGRGQGQSSSNCPVLWVGPDTWGTEGKSVSLALDHIQPPADLHRALMTKQFSRPKSCWSIRSDCKSLSYFSVAQHRSAQVDALAGSRRSRQKCTSDRFTHTYSHNIYFLPEVMMWDDFRALLCKTTGELLMRRSVSVSHAKSLAHWSDRAAVSVCVFWPVCAVECEASGCCFRVTAGVGLNGPVQEASLSLVDAHSLSVLLLSHHY